MGQCCSSSKVDGVCIICLKQCRTKACNCSFMHKECAVEYVSFKKVCPICNVAYALSYLEKKPNECPQEESELLLIRKKQLIHERREKHFYNMWGKRFFPFLIVFYKTHRLFPKSLIIALQCILEDTSNRVSFTQFLLNRSWKQDEITCEFNVISNLVLKYDVMNIKIKKSIIKVYNSYCKQYDVLSATSMIEYRAFDF